MYVDVDARGVHRQTDEIRHCFVLGYQTLKGRLHRFGEIGMAHETVVDKEKLLGALLARTLGRTDITAQLHQTGVDLDGDKGLVQLPTKDAKNPLLELAGRKVEQAHIVAVQLHRHVGMGQRQALELGRDVTQLRLIGLQEFTACRNVEKKVLHQEIGTDRASHGVLARYFRALDGQAHA